MRIIDTRTHGYMDYLMGLLLIISPWLFDFADGGAQQWVPMVLGVMAFFYSIITDYELGLLKILPMKVHLIMDILSGVLLALSPWIFSFADEVYLPHLILGLVEIGAGLMTKQHSSQPETSVK